ncbi:uncharacterized protein F4822DRAFT_413153 [Hypoxylon trugodes]|uniref:uncharacterized protein n=1 Tax=Hypoxylon trugodes TaxID=326681 RepID=UPI002195AD9A|nr:uncharacterized protein F4822DRAFT_413153 [Hypoxylon trugodes]KAI1385495.1 hypothetical protein F4822DRAFT_413153 [Hypoxylon trugodes]
MSGQSKSRVLVVGAGSMGIISGYILSLAGADVTFLIRPHRKEALSRPQILYSYDDNSLKEYKGYDLITSPSDIIGKNFDYILITLDGTALQNETGTNLVKTIGEAARNTNTKVILGTVFVDLRTWFLKTSGLAEDQVANATLAIHIYATKDVTLPANPPVDPELVAKSDFAFTDKLGDGIVLTDNAPAAAKGFAELWNASKLSKCSVIPAVVSAANINPFFAVLAGCDILGWPRYKDLDTNNEVWKLSIRAVKEIQGLGIHGEPGQQAATATTEENFAAQMKGLENQMLPFELQAFNRFHHGGKVNVQDTAHLRTCLRYGEAERKTMDALKELIQRVEEHKAAA